MLSMTDGDLRLRRLIDDLSERYTDVSYDALTGESDTMLKPGVEANLLDEQLIQKVIEAHRLTESIRARFGGLN